ncbi:hypothetical protein NM208_g7692 [Fusarium decemcellulare]|uniref:Uncharacterized protein n=1 Tax=Fusarium decemcellulare TaxID=57161 RepID=A0ACC1S8B9_9HYPO|nr:hypothetical protein NM208_g7692 [Fusarium decemcellulare]
MTSICNYSHPELQITDGLVRQKTGVLFPYNPEFYDNVTGLYGPGTIYCWYMLLASVLAGWLFCPLDDQGVRKLGISNDLLGALAYPAFAATDLLIQAMRMLGTKHRALAIFCLRFPETELTGFGPFNSTQLNLNDIPPDILSLGQKAIDVTGPLTICYTAAAVFFTFVPVYCFADQRWVRSWEPKATAATLLWVTYVYIVLVLVIFHLSLGNLGASLILVLYEAMLPYEFFVIYATNFAVAVALVSSFISTFWNLCMGKRAEAIEDLKTFGSCLLAAGFLAIPGALGIYFNKLKLIPDLAVSVKERDQLATLIVGAVTLAFTLFHTWFKIPEREAGEEETQMLPTTEATGDTQGSP